jgi:hypothetical protein
MDKQLDDLITKKAKEFLENEIFSFMDVGLPKQEAMEYLNKYYKEHGLKDTLYAEAVEIFELFKDAENIETEIHQPLQRKVLQLLQSKMKEQKR